MSDRAGRDPGEPATEPASGPEDSLLSAAFLEEMLARFARDPRAVPNDWREYLAANDGTGNGNGGGVRLLPRFAPAPGRAVGVGTAVERAPGAAPPTLAADEAANAASGCSIGSPIISTRSNTPCVRSACAATTC